MKRYQSAFAVPSGFAVSSAAAGKPKAARRGDAAHRATEMQGGAPLTAKTRSARDIRDRAA